MASEEVKHRLIETYRHFYFQELDQKEKLNGRLPVLIAVYSVLLGVIGAFLNDAPQSDSTFIAACFYTLLCTQLAMLVLSVVFAVLFVNCDERDIPYVMTPDPLNGEPLDIYQRIETEIIRKVKEYRKAIKSRRLTWLRRYSWLRQLTRIFSRKATQHRKASSSELLSLQGINAYLQEVDQYNFLAPPNARIDSGSELTTLLCEQYGAAATGQFRLNRDKRVYYRRAFRFLVASIAIGSLCGVSYFYIKVNSPKTIYKVKIIDEEVKTMTGNNERSGDAGQKETFSDSSTEERTKNSIKKPVRPGPLMLRDSDTVSRSVQRIRERSDRLR